MLFSQVFLFDLELVFLRFAERQPFRKKDIDFPFIEQAGMCVVGLDGQNMLPETDDFDLLRIVIDTQKGIGIGPLPLRMRKIIRQMYYRCVGRLLQDLQIQIHVSRTTGGVQSLQAMQLRGYTQEQMIIFLAQVEQLSYRGKVVQQMVGS